MASHYTPSPVIDRLLLRLHLSFTHFVNVYKLTLQTRYTSSVHLHNNDDKIFSVFHSWQGLQVWIVTQVSACLWPHKELRMKVDSFHSNAVSVALRIQWPHHAVSANDVTAVCGQALSCCSATTSIAAIAVASTCQCDHKSDIYESACVMINYIQYNILPHLRLNLF